MSIATINPKTTVIAKTKDEAISSKKETKPSLQGGTKPSLREEMKPSLRGGTTKQSPPCIPELRFKEFEGEWEKYKVGDLCDCIVPGRNKPKQFNGDIVWITTPDIVHSSSVFNSKSSLGISIDEAKNVGSKIVPKDSVIISCVGDLGLVALAGVEMIINQQLHAFLPSEKIEHRFLMYSIMTQMKFIDKVATKTAVPYMNKNNCNSIPVYKPTLPEQQKIASFLAAVDKKIQQLSKKKALLAQYKKGVMQQLFSQKIRFTPSIADFEEERAKGLVIDIAANYPDWEEKRLGEVGKIITGSTPPTSNSDYYNGEFLFVSPADINSSRYVFNTKTTLTELGYSKGRKITKDAVLFVCIGSTIGKVAQAGTNCITNQQINTIEALEEYSNEFIYSLLVFFGSRIKLLAGVQAVPQINKTDFSKFKYNFPSLPEQKKIAAYLSSIDTKIEAVHNEIIQTQTFKKGLLQRMFV